MAFWDEEDDDFDDEEYERERKEEEESFNSLPIVKKAKDLFTTITAFMETLEDSEDDVDLKPHLFEDVAVINAKIRGAEAGDLYRIRMENAVIIKVHAVSIRNIMHTYEMLGVGNTEYLELIRNEIEAFRLVFVEWVNSFDRFNDLDEDEWGLFN